MIETMDTDEERLRLEKQKESELKDSETARRAVCASYRTSTSGAEKILPIDHHCLTCPKAGMLLVKKQNSRPHK
jgi:hypothetical protein